MASWQTSDPNTNSSTTTKHFALSTLIFISRQTFLYTVTQFTIPSCRWHVKSLQKQVFYYRKFDSKLLELPSDWLNTETRTTRYTKLKVLPVQTTCSCGTSSLREHTTKLVFFIYNIQFVCMNVLRGKPGGTDLKRGHGDVRPWGSPFQASPVVHKGSSKRDGLAYNTRPQKKTFEKNGNLASIASIFEQTLALKPSSFEIFSSQAPSFRGKNQPFKTHTSEIWTTHP